MSPLAWGEKAKMGRIPNSSRALHSSRRQNAPYGGATYLHTLPLLQHLLQVVMVESPVRTLGQLQYPSPAHL